MKVKDSLPEKHIQTDETVADWRSALMHARPGEGVLEQSMSLLVTKQPIDLEGKPVRIFLVLAAADSESHLESLKEIMAIFMDEEKYNVILNGDREQICQLFQ